MVELIVAGLWTLPAIHMGGVGKHCALLLLDRIAVGENTQAGISLVTLDFHMGL